MPALEMMKDISFLKHPLSKAVVVKLANAAGTDFSVDDLLNATISAEHPSVAFRAAWLLETVMMTHPDKFLPYTNLFFTIYPKQSNPGCQRHFTKIMMLCLKNAEFIPGKEASMLDRIVETTFDWLAGDSPAAVKVNCMDVLYLLRYRSSWIKDELQAQIEFLMRNGGPAIQSRGGRLLSKINRTKG